MFALPGPGPRDLLPRTRALLSGRLRQALAPACFVCGVLPGDPACARCCADFFPVDVARCPRCANPVPPASDFADSLPCGACLAMAPAFDATVTLGAYVAPLDRMVQALKSAQRLDLGRAFGRLLALRLMPIQFDGVVALPLARSRLRARGFNQAQEIARALARELHLPLLPDALRRVRDTPSQQSLSLARRRANVRGAFGAPRVLTLRHVLLVDDVMTTGASLGAAASCLKRAGVARVTNAVVARTP
jgi:ComF family protein